MLGAQQRGDAGDVRRGETGAVVDALAEAGDGGDHVDSGRRHPDEVAGLGEPGPLVVAVRGSHREHAGEGSRVGLALLAAHAVVARGGHHHDVGGYGLLDRLAEIGVGGQLRVGVLGDVDHLGALGHRVVDGLAQVRGVALALPVVLPDRDDRGLRGQADEAGALLGTGRDQPGDLGAVADGVDRAVAALGVDEVLAGSGVDGCAELRVRPVHAGVDDRDADAVAALVLALGLRPELVEQQPLQGPGPVLDLLLHREGALPRAVEAQRVRGLGRGGCGRGGGRARAARGQGEGEGGGQEGPPGRVGLGHRRLPHEPWGWRAELVSRRGPLERNSDQAMGTMAGLTLP